MNKNELRIHLKEIVANISTEKQKSASDGVCQRLLSIASVAHSGSIFVYLPMKDEINLLSLIGLWLDESRTVCVPLINWEDNTMRGGLLTSLNENALIETKFGIKEPKDRQPLPSDCIDVLLAPGIGFDRQGGRLGRGGGFYDRFIASVRPPIVIGVCFDEQIIKTIPRDSHDQLMSAVVTPTKVYFE
jgi:5-formyltetrahydrofolate cyclo-ligase